MDECLSRAVTDSVSPFQVVFGLIFGAVIMIRMIRPAGSSGYLLRQNTTTSGREKKKTTIKSLETSNGIEFGKQNDMRCLVTVIGEQLAS